MDQVERWPAPPLDLRAIVGECVRNGGCGSGGRLLVEALAVAECTAGRNASGYNYQTSQGKKQQAAIEIKVNCWREGAVGGAAARGRIK